MEDLERTRDTRELSPRLLATEHGTSRRRMLLGSAGVVGALAGGTLLARTPPVDAATPRSEAAVTRKEQALRITLTPLTSSGVFWARHDWHLDARFTGERAPTVVANAADDFMEHDVTSACTCSVRVQGTPGAYVAVILVRGIHKSARTVEVNALALDL